MKCDTCKDEITEHNKAHDTPYWCAECDEKRVAKITKSLEEILESFGKKRRGNEKP